jgi:hypothetical protein
MDDPRSGEGGELTPIPGDMARHDDEVHIYHDGGNGPRARTEGTKIMDDQLRAQCVKALRQIQKSLTRPEVMHGPPGTDAGRIYAARQVNSIRDMLVEGDPTVGILFPSVPEELSLSEIGSIAGQIADFVDPTEPAPPKETGGSPNTQNISVEIGDGVVFGAPNMEHIGEIVRTALAAAMEGLGGVARAAGGVANKAGDAATRAAGKVRPKDDGEECCAEGEPCTAEDEGEARPPADEG